MRFCKFLEKDKTSMSKNCYELEEDSDSSEEDEAYDRRHYYHPGYAKLMIEQKLKPSYEELLVDSIYNQSIVSSDCVEYDKYKEIYRIVSRKLFKASVYQCFKRAFKLLLIDIDSGKHPVSCLSHILHYKKYPKLCKKIRECMSDYTSPNPL